MSYMKQSNPNWYKEIWSLDIKSQSWIEDTQRQVDFMINIMKLSGNERILDLACGFGRHSLEFARRGYQVVGVDITKDYIEDAQKELKKESLPVEFIQSDVRDIHFNQEFDVVLNMADGAIGYLENEEENLKIFDVISRALRPGGKHFMDIMNADYADTHFPCNQWEAGKQGLTLSRFEWNKESKILLYGQIDYKYGTPLTQPIFEEGFPTRLYHSYEIDQILKERNMKVIKEIGTFDGKPASPNEIQMMVYSKKGC